jgi:hypothetical protein
MNAFSHSHRPAALALAVTLFLAAAPTRAQILGDFEALDAFGSALASGDFDGDGFLDLAVGVHLEDVGSVSDAGAVNVLYGRGIGLDDPRNQFWHQDSPGITGDAETGDFFGFAVAAGDFDGDGRDDLAIGLTGEDVAGVTNAGAVIVLYGAAAGLTTDRTQFWSQGSPGVEDDVELSDGFGSALTAGDFNGDGRDDLAIGVGSEDLGALADAGAVNVLYGTASGLSAATDQFIHQDSPNVQDAAESDDFFGYALASGDFNGDGYDDLAVGVSDEDIVVSTSTYTDAGAINVLYGSASRLTATGNRLFRQGNSGVLDLPESNDHYGRSLASGDFDGDGYDDLAIGVDEESVGTVSDAGAVNVLYGTDRGLRTPGNQLWHQDSPNILDTAESTDRFGYSLTAGDFDGDGRDDLAIGVYDENLTASGGGTATDAGAVNVLYGAGAGLSDAGNQFWTQDSPGITGEAESSDRFGESLAAGDFDGDGFDDLAIGDPQEDLAGFTDPGALHALYGAAGPGLTANGDQLWRQGATSLLADAETDAAAAAVTGAPSALALDTPYPNPAAGAVTLAFALPEPGPARLAVYDVTGRRVAVVADGAHAAGRHLVVWDGRAGAGAALPSGVYVVRLEVGDPAGGAGGRVLAHPLTILR